MTMLFPLSRALRTRNPEGGEEVQGDEGNDDRGVARVGALAHQLHETAIDSAPSS